MQVATARGVASKITEEGKATAAAIRALGATWAKAGDSARQIFVAQKLSRLVETMMSTVGEMPIDKLTIIDRELAANGSNLAVKAAVTSEQIKLASTPPPRSRPWPASAPSPPCRPRSTAAAAAVADPAGPAKPRARAGAALQGQADAAARGQAAGRAEREVAAGPGRSSQIAAAVGVVVLCPTAPPPSARSDRRCGESQIAAAVDRSAPGAP
jgi:hypothetical protein